MMPPPQLNIAAKTPAEGMSVTNARNNRRMPVFLIFLTSGAYVSDTGI
jgi:hypothetical protein